MGLLDVLSGTAHGPRGNPDPATPGSGRGENLPITPRQLEAALGVHAIGDMMEEAMMEHNELLETLSRYLPCVIDHLNPRRKASE